MELLKGIENLFYQYGILAFLPIALIGVAIGFITKFVFNKLFQIRKNRQTEKQNKSSKFIDFILRAYLAFWALVVLYAVLPLQLWFIALAITIYFVFYPPQILPSVANEPPIEYQIEALEKKIKKLLAKKHLTEKDRLKLIEYQVKLTNLKEQIAYEEGYRKGYRKGRLRGDWC